MGKKSKIYEIEEEEFRQIVSNSHNYSECLRKFGLTTCGGHSRDVLKRRIGELHISTSHFRYEYYADKRKIPLSEILVRNSTYLCSSRLKQRLIKEGLLKNECSICGINKWNGRDLVLQLDHKNGNKYDCRLSNLRLLCPNCHSQTNTYAGKNNHSYKRPDRMLLKHLIRTTSFLQISKKYHVSDNAVRKWCKYYHLPHLKSEIRKISDEDWKLI